MTDNDDTGVDSSQQSRGKRSCHDRDTTTSPNKRPKPSNNDDDADASVEATDVKLECDDESSSTSASQENPKLPLLESSAVIEKPTKKRWRTHQMAEDYMELVGNLMYPGTRLGPYGPMAANGHNGQYPLEQVTCLGYLASPLRRPSVIEMWSPHEIAMFEASLSIYGKEFHKVTKAIGTNKTTKDVIEFYYIWKKTSHYTAWKKQYVSDIDMASSDDEMDKKGTGKPNNNNNHNSVVAPSARGRRRTSNYK